MADAGMAGERLGFQPGFQVLELALGAAARQVPAFQRSDACGIVSSVFQALERIDQQSRDRAAPSMPTIPHMRFNIPKSS